MPTKTVSLHIKYSKNMDIIMSPRDLMDLYFYGVDVKARDGSVIPEYIYVAFIQAAQQEIEKYLSIKLVKQVIEEDHTYYGSDWESWGVIQTSYPVNKAYTLTGFYGKQKHIIVPNEWLIAKRSSDDLFHRSCWLVPNGIGNLQQSTAFFGGVVPYIRIGNGATVPDYWQLKYVTGFEKIPMDIYNVVGLLAAINIFSVLGDLVLGVGVASKSISLDSLSQSISSVKSGDNSGYGARINGYIKQMNSTLPRLKEFYAGIKFTCV